MAENELKPCQCGSDDLIVEVQRAMEQAAVDAVRLAQEGEG